MKFWGDLSIAKKLYLVIGTMAVLIGCELATLRFAMHNLSAVRAFVEGEGTWSKAQKDAVLSLQRYAITRDEAEYSNFLEQLKVPEGDHRARLELSKPRFDMEVVRQGFLQGQIHPDDIEGIVDLLRRFYRISYLARAIEVWAEADQRLDDFKQAGIRYHTLLSSPKPDPSAVRGLSDRLSSLNAELTRVEKEFSSVLSEGSRWMEHVVITILFFAVLMVESFGLTLTFKTTRALSRDLAHINQAADRMGRGDFSQDIPIRSRDELGALTKSINTMGWLLERSYRDLENRVRSRTTELEALAKENARLYAQATEAVRMRDEFFSIASHELKTPLTGLNLQLQLILRQVNEPQLTTQVESCLRQSRRLAQLSEELMDLTRIRMGQFEIRREKCDLATLVRDVALQLGPDAARAASTLEIQAAAPVVGQFDMVRMGQVVTNLISNAIKYGKSKPISVYLHQTAGRAYLTVKDHGQGIAPTDQERVFDRFERANERDSKVAGLGLGLYITRQIVEKHGGTITLKSVLAEGSQFTVELPLV